MCSVRQGLWCGYYKHDFHFCPKLSYNNNDKKLPFNPQKIKIIFMICMSEPRIFLNILKYLFLLLTK
jgi:hypothetical protein